jgi:hypothetical protein
LSKPQADVVLRLHSKADQCEVTDSKEHTRSPQ